MPSAYDGIIDYEYLLLMQDEDLMEEAYGGIEYPTEEEFVELNFNGD